MLRYGGGSPSSGTRGPVTALFAPSSPPRSAPAPRLDRRRPSPRRPRPPETPVAEPPASQPGVSARPAVAAGDGCDSSRPPTARPPASLPSARRRRLAAVVRSPALSRWRIRAHSPTQSQAKAHSASGSPSDADPQVGRQEVSCCKGFLRYRARLVRFRLVGQAVKIRCDGLVELDPNPADHSRNLQAAGSRLGAGAARRPPAARPAAPLRLWMRHLAGVGSPGGG